MHMITKKLYTRRLDKLQLFSNHFKHAYDYQETLYKEAW